MADTARIVEPISPEEYLAREELNQVRHEYVGGAMYAMSGATDRHNRIASNLHVALSNHLPDRCVPYMADMKVRIRRDRAEMFFYPDCMVCCGPSDQALVWRDNPLLIGEVLSPTTEKIDRTGKLDAYTKIPSLEDYAIIDQAMARIEVYRRGKAWQREILLAGDTLRLPSLDFTIGVDALYRRVEF